MPANYVTTQIAVLALQWNATIDTAAVRQWVVPLGYTVRTVRVVDQQRLAVTSASNRVVLDRGDWLVRHPGGLLRVTADAFGVGYELA